jgi:hypothetical protein
VAEIGEASMTTAGNRVTRAAAAGIILAVLVAVPPSRSAEAQNAEIESSTRFADTLRLTTPKGASVPLHVEFKEWNVPRNARGTELPEQGFYIAHLASGEVVTEIGGKSETRHPGDFWTVDKGARMRVLIRAPREAAVVQTLAVSPSH